MLGHFRLLPFLLGLGLASIVFMVYKPEKQIIHKYPHPIKSENLVFKDHNSTCYKYSSHEVDCDANEATLTDYPVQG